MKPVSIISNTQKYFRVKLTEEKITVVSIFVRKGQQTFSLAKRKIQQITELKLLYKIEFKCSLCE